MKLLPVLLGLLASSASVIAGETIGSGGPFNDLNDADYSAFFNQNTLNATGSITFDGYNMSEPFPPNKTLPGWGAKIEVATTDFGNGGTAYPATRISFSAPEGVVLPENATESGWESCVILFPPEWLKNSVRSKKPVDGDTSCSFLSEKCQAGLLALANSYARYNDPKSDVPGTCLGSLRLPEDCEGSASDDMSTIAGFSPDNMSSMFNGSTAISLGSSFSGDESPEDASKEVEDLYDVSVGGYWTILINWGRRDPSSFSPGEVPQGSVLCLKADQLLNDSEGDAARPLFNAALALVMSSCVAFSLL